MLNTDTILVGLIQYFVLLFSLSVHESSHAWTANRLGDPTAKYLGRISLNPLPHADLLGTLIFPLMMIFSNIPLIGWAKPVPVNLQNLRNPRRDHLRIAAAGPLSNLALSGIFFGLLALLVRTSHPARMTLQNFLQASPEAMGTPSSHLEPVLLFLIYGVFLNALLAVFNLIPSPPLDGGTILLGLLPEPFAEKFEGLTQFGFLFLFLLLATGVLNTLFYPFSSMITHALFRLAL